MQLTTHGTLYGLLLDDGVELVGDGSGMTLAECEAWLDRIEKENEIRLASRPASTKGQAVGGAPLGTLGRSN